MLPRNVVMSTLPVDDPVDADAAERLILEAGIVFLPIAIVMELQLPQPMLNANERNSTEL